jgi:ketol-acid reductoisomerase
MTIVYHEDDGNLNTLNQQTIGVIGFGRLGAPAARSLRDSGLPVIVGGDAEHQQAAAADGFPTGAPAELTARCNIIMLMLPDELMTPLYLEQIAPGLHRGHTLVLSSGYNVAFGFIEPPPFVDVCLIAPRTVSSAIRHRYADERRYYTFLSVGQDSSGSAWDTVLALALALGALRYGAVEVSIEQEAELTLFIQQAVLPAFHHIMLTAAHLLMRSGYPTDAILPDLYLAGKFNDYMQEAVQSGLLHALESTPLSGQYGTYSRLSRFNELKLERLMEATLDEIRSGEFAQEWAAEVADGLPRLARLSRQQADLDLWELEQQSLDFLRETDE